jgi:hypothetical protein
VHVALRRHKAVGSVLVGVLAAGLAIGLGADPIEVLAYVLGIPLAVLTGLWIFRWMYASELIGLDPDAGARDGVAARRTDMSDRGAPPGRPSSPSAARGGLLALLLGLAAVPLAFASVLTTSEAAICGGTLVVIGVLRVSRSTAS